MVIDVFTQLGQPGHDDRYLAAVPGLRDGVRPAVAHDHTRLVEQIRELAELEELRPGTGRPGRGRAPLHEEPVGLLGMSLKPLIRPADKPVEGVVIGPRDDHDAAADRSGRLGRGALGPSGHSRHPITCPRG
jgi:hypothetical protein